jgi:hypothetical protein
MNKFIQTRYIKKLEQEKIAKFGLIFFFTSAIILAIYNI